MLATSRFLAPVGLEVLDRIGAKDLAGARLLLDWLREDWHLAGGDDPLLDAPFPRFWARGKDADASQMKLAAAALLVWTKTTALRGIAIFEGPEGSARDDATRSNIALALMVGYGNLEEYQKQLAAASGLATQFPDSRSLFFGQLADLFALGRFDDGARLVEDRLRRIPGDRDAMHGQVRAAVYREEYSKAHDLEQKIIDADKAEAFDLNNMAWYSLLAGKVAPSDIEGVLKASQLNRNSSSTLHTLGCLCAEVGKTKEAREVLVQSMDLLNLDEPNPDYWYAFGRIAEQYGERDAALANYARVTKPKRAVEIPDSTYYLAQVRLQALRGEKQ
jgi:tetratricopeptide (TPR) repeat protein